MSFINHTIYNYYTFPKTGYLTYSGIRFIEQAEDGFFDYRLPRQGVTPPQVGSIIELKRDGITTVYVVESIMESDFSKKCGVCKLATP